MKKIRLPLIFLTTLVLSGCNNGTTLNPDDNKEQNEQNNNNQQTIIDDDDPKIEDENEVECANLYLLEEYKNELLLVDQNIKNYTDAMYDQRTKGQLSEEDKINDLYGDTVKIKTYKGNYDKSEYVKLAFSVDDSISAEEFKVRCWPKGNKQLIREVDAVNKVGSFDNLLRGTEYEWCVVSSSGKKSAVSTFKTADYVRFVNCGSLFNVRDFGGWTTLDGRKVKQGMIYRGGEINEIRLKSGHEQNVFGDEDPAKDIFTKVLGIRFQLDLRNDAEADYMTRCPMNKEGMTEANERYVTYERVEVDSYAVGLNTPMYQQNIAHCFNDIFTNLDKKPVYCNCYGGADRTGTIFFLLGSILGMSYTDIVIDYESTSFSNNYKAHDQSATYSKYPEMIFAIKEWSFYNKYDSLQTIMEKYLTTVCGVKQESIEKIRNIMLESPAELEEE